MKADYLLPIHSDIEYTLPFRKVGTGKGEHSEEMVGQSTMEAQQTPNPAPSTLTSDGFPPSGFADSNIRLILGSTSSMQSSLEDIPWFWHL